MRILSLATIAVAASLATPALAQPIASGPEGAPIIVTTTDPVIATYLGTTAAFSDNLYLVRSGMSDLFLFNNQSSAVGSTVDLGTFPLLSELIFRLEVTDFNGAVTNYFSGSPTRNPDLAAHARVQADYLTTGTTLVSFEDLPRMVDSSFNDLSFSFTGTGVGSVPEPATWAMMIAGMGAVGGALRRRAKRTVRVTYA